MRQNLFSCAARFSRTTVRSPSVAALRHARQAIAFAPVSVRPAADVTRAIALSWGASARKIALMML